MAERHDGGGGGGSGKGGKILSMTVKRARRVQEKVRALMTFCCVLSAPLFVAATRNVRTATGDVWVFK